MRRAVSKVSSAGVRRRLVSAGIDVGTVTRIDRIVRMPTGLLAGTGRVAPSVGVLSVRGPPVSITSVCITSVSVPSVCVSSLCVPSHVGVQPIRASELTLDLLP